MNPNLQSVNPSSTSLNITDSAYASNSRSGTTSVAQSSHMKNKSHVARSSSASDGMSGGSGASPQAATSERNKMKEAVRRLEHLFTGFKSKHPGSTPDSTNSDRSGSNAGSVIPEEGARGASMMNPLEDKQTAEFRDPTVVSQSELHDNGSVETDQRPTRAKDLDPGRSNKAEDNIEYLSNLTHSAAVGNGEGWFYLNLIINMAQLHTISVTVPFVKKAIATVSEKLELSVDGKMVRWRGGLEGTRLSSESSSGSGVDSASITSDGSPEESWDGARKRSPNDSDGNVMSIDPPSKSGSRGRTSSSGRRFPALSSPASVGDKFHYKPMFAQPVSFDDDASSIISTSMGSFPRGSSDEDVSSVTRKTLPLDGPIIYYEGGKFCTDLTTQLVREGKLMAMSPTFPYERFTNNPIGEKQPVPLSPNTKRESPLFAKDRPPSILLDNDSMNIDDDSDMGLQFSPRFSSSIPHAPPPPIELEVSGIGGVLPEDNFAINVQKRHFLLPQNANGALPCSRKKLSKSKILQKISYNIPKSSIETFQQNEEMSDSPEESSDENGGSEGSEPSELDSGDERSNESGAQSEEEGSSDSESSDTPAKHSRRFNRHKLIRPELVSVHILRLEPSSLPPANCIYFASSDDTSSVDTDSGAEPHSSSSEGYRLRMLAQDNTDIYGNSENDDDELSNEILAANGMRIYRPVQATAESGAAGSSAATAGDASGYSTPAVAPMNEATMANMNIIDMNSNSGWGDSPGSGSGSGDQSPSTAGDDDNNFGMVKDRPSLKRGRGSGTSSSESAIGLVRKTARKCEKAIMLDDLY